MYQHEELIEACDCSWCANLDASPCRVIMDLRRRVQALEAASPRPIGGLT